MNRSLEKCMKEIEKLVADKYKSCNDIAAFVANKYKTLKDIEGIKCIRYGDDFIMSEAEIRTILKVCGKDKEELTNLEKYIAHQFGLKAGDDYTTGLIKGAQHIIDFNMEARIARAGLNVDYWDMVA